MESTLKPSERLVMEKKLLSLLLPQEVWSLVFAKLSLSAKTLQSCANSSLGFRHWLQTNNGNNLATNIFSLVFPSLVRYLNLQNTSCTETNRGNCSIVLKCRLTCHSWSHGVDQYFQSLSTVHHVRAKENFDWKPIVSSNISLWQALLYPYGFEINWNKFVDHFASTHNLGSRSPFLGKSMVLHLNWLDHGSNQMLELYGKQVWHCGLVYRSFRYLHELNEILQEVLLKLPNLRTLSIFGLDKYVFTEVLVTQRAADILRSSFPTLPFLLSLRTEYVPGQIVEEMLKNNADTLKFSSNLQIGPPHHVATQLPCLQFLLLNARDKREFRMVKNGSNLNTLALKIEKAGRSWTFSQSLQIIEQNIPTSVRTLLLYLPEYSLKESMVKTRLCLPSVQRLKIQLQNWMPLDFILPMKDNLEALCISVPANSFGKWISGKSAKRIMENEVIMFLQSHEDMASSNIWELFSRLKFLKICHRTDANRVCAWKRMKRNIEYRNYSSTNHAEEFVV